MIEEDNWFWMELILSAWEDDLTDERQDIYTMEDGGPVEDGSSTHFVGEF